MKKKLRLGLIGSGFMGKTHVFGFAAAARVFDLPYDVELTAIADVTIDGGRVSHVGKSVPGNGAVVEDASGCLVLPGLVDFHTHVFFGGTSLAVQAEPFAARSGVVGVSMVVMRGPSSWGGRCRPRAAPWGWRRRRARRRP